MIKRPKFCSRLANRENQTEYLKCFVFTVMSLKFRLQLNRKSIDLHPFMSVKDLSSYNSSVYVL